MIVNRRQTLSFAASMAAASLWPCAARAQEKSTLVRLTSVRFGSVSWIVDTIRSEGIDKKYGLNLEVVEVANNSAAPIALLSGDADIVVSDWTWAMRQRAKGQDFKFASYSSALGSLMVPKDSPIKTLADLEGKKIGVAGSGIDKSWILLRAYSRKLLGKDKDIAKTSETIFGAAPLITEEFRSGRLDACLNFWTYAARLEGEGAREIIRMSDIIKALNISPPPPLVGFIWSEKAALKNNVPIDLFLAAVNDANTLLAKSEEAWERLRPLVKPATDDEFAAIKTYFRSGITEPWGANETASAEKLTNLLIELGDEELVGDGTRFDPNLFHIKAG